MNQLEAINAAFNEEIAKLKREKSAMREKYQNKIVKMKVDFGLELRAVETILRAIRDSQSSHWQKKENIRLVLEILNNLPSLDRDGSFSFMYDDDF